MLAQAQQMVSDAIKEKTQAQGVRKTGKAGRSSEMTNVINTLLSLRDAVRIKSPWSPSSQGNGQGSGLNLGMLSNSASLLHEMENSAALSLEQNGSGGKNNALRERQRSSDSNSPPNGASPNGHYGVGSGSNAHHQFSGNGVDNERLTPTEILDELSYIYPQEDFSLLRVACLKNEITLTKLSARLNGNGFPGSGSPTGQGNEGSEEILAQLQLFKQQSEYMQMLQQSGVLPGDAGNLAGGFNLANTGDSKYPSWLHPLAAAAAAAAGMSIPSTSRQTNGNSNGGGKRKSSTSASDHVFLSPKYPVSATKPKTVAAALAASRHSPSNMNVPNGRKRGAPVNKRKRTQHVPAYMNDDDMIDPSALVEVTTTPESHYGMDLTKTNGRKKSLNEDYLSPDFKNDNMPMTNGQDALSAAHLSLESYLRDAQSTQKAVKPDDIVDENNLSEQEQKKRNVLTAFNNDPDVGGDARGVARKFGLNIRIVLKWLREGPSKSLPALPGSQILAADVQSSSSDGDHSQDSPSSAYMDQHGINNNGSDEASEAMNNNYKMKSTASRRKNAKPNQICDFQTEELQDDVEEESNPLDMVVPIKKRRVSSSSGA